MEDDQHLRAGWEQAWRALRMAPPAGEFERIAAMYRAREGYHSLPHLVHVIGVWKEHFEHFAYPGEAGIALFFHDAIYVPGRSDNEARSAELANDALMKAGADGNARSRVRDLVLATRHSAEPLEDDARLVVDIDLSILAAEESRYAEYVDGVRREYSRVPRFLFDRGRRKLLEDFLARERIFLTPYFAPLERRARENLRRELVSL